MNFNPLEFDGVNRDNKKSPTGCNRQGIEIEQLTPNG